MWKTVAKPTLVCTVFPGLMVYKDRSMSAAELTVYKDRPVAAEEMTFSLYPGHFGVCGNKKHGDTKVQTQLWSHRVTELWAAP